MKINYPKLVLAILIPQMAGGLGSFFTIESVSTWYMTLIKPEFNPPSWVFGPVWTILYLLMGIALYLVWTGSGKIKKVALIIFGGQLLLNVLWSVLFFGLQSPLYAFGEIIVLWIFIAFNIWAFYRVSKGAAYLLVPYILWVSFAVVLNYYLLILN